MTSCLRLVGITDRFPQTVFQRSADFKIFLFFSLHYQLFETNQNMEKPLSILMGLKGGDCIRKAEVNIGPQCVQNRRSVGSSRKESKRAVRDCSFNNIQASVTVSCSKSVYL